MSQSNMISEYKHSQSSFALEKASTNNIRGIDRKGEASCLGTSKLLLVKGGTRRRRRHRGSSRRGGRHLGSSAPGLHRQLQRPIRQNSKGNKSSEYLIYPRVLRPATKLMHYQMERGKLYSGLQDSKYKDKREYARPIEDQHLPMSLAAWGKNQPTVYITEMKVTLHKKLLQHCIIISCNS